MMGPDQLRVVLSTWSRKQIKVVQSLDVFASVAFKNVDKCNHKR